MWTYGLKHVLKMGQNICYWSVPDSLGHMGTVHSECGSEFTEGWVPKVKLSGVQRKDSLL